MRTIILAALMLAACGDKTPTEGNKCSEEGALVCGDDLLLECVDGELVLEEDCNIAYDECVDEDDGAAYCYAEADVM